MIKHRLFRLILAASLITAVLAPTRAFAENGTADDIENLFDKDEQAPAPQPNSGSNQNAGASTDAGAQSKKIDAKEVSDLQNLSDFKDIAVIQRRYLPKTGRYEFFIGGLTTLNDAFFTSYGIDLRLAYYFQERYGIEFVGSYIATSSRTVTDELHDNLGVDTKALITPKGYYGLDFKWSPIYGKMAWQNKSIVPFDMYFSLGLGASVLNQSGTAGTLHLGTGQVFAINKWSGVRWDFSWDIFSAQSNVTPGSGSSIYNNLILTVGYSLFFPEATYR